MDYYIIEQKQASKLVSTMERYRKEEKIIQYTGNDYNEKKSKVEYTYPYNPSNGYGVPINYYLMVVGNSISLNIVYQRFRVAYTLQAPNNWAELEIEAFGDDFYHNVARGEKLFDEGIKIIENLIVNSFENGGMGSTTMSRNPNYLQSILSNYAE